MHLFIYFSYMLVVCIFTLILMGVHNLIVCTFCESFNLQCILDALA